MQPLMRLGEFKIKLQTDGPSTLQSEFAATSLESGERRGMDMWDDICFLQGLLFFLWILTAKMEEGCVRVRVDRAGWV